MLQRCSGMMFLATAFLSLSVLNLAGCSKSAEEVESTDTVKGAAGSSQTSNPGGAEATHDHDAEGGGGTVGGVAPPAAGAAGASADGMSFALPGLVFDKPAAWVNEMPSSTMRAAQFNIPAPTPTEGAEAPTGPATQLVVFYFGASGAGGIEANLVRWANQLAQPDGTPSIDHAITSEKQVGGMTVHLLEVTGTQVAETTPGSGIRVNNPDHILLTAIVETTAGPYYFKLVGPLTTIGPFKADFAAMVDSFRSP